MADQRYTRATSPFRRRSRRAVAAVEAAIAMPVIFVLAFGSIELADGIFLKQALAVAAYEGARAVSHPEGISAQARLRTEEILSARGVTGYAITISPEATLETPRGTQMTVHLTAPSSSISWSPLRLLSGRMIEKTVCMVRQ